VFVRVGSTAFSAVVSPLEPETSIHTGRTLARASVTFEVRTPGRQDEVAGVLSGSGASITIIDDGNEMAVDVLQHTMGQAMAESRWLHRVAVRQHEDLSPTCLVMDGIEYVPERYSETARSGGIIATFAVVLTGPPAGPEAHLRTIGDGGYFDLVRRGIDDRLRRMRCGRCRWELHEDRRVYHLNLIEACVDEADPLFGFMRPELDNLLDSCAHQQIVVQSLIDRLRGLGVLSDDQVASVLADAERAAAAHRWDLRRLVPLAASER
jgi:hypothetical protein